MSEEKMDKERIASRLREIAKNAEAIEQTCDLTSNDRDKNGVHAFFSCNAVAKSFDREFAEKYRELFVEDVLDLWNDGARCMSRRILSLCFFAAMVETGDA